MRATAGKGVGATFGAGERLPGSLWSFVTAFSCGTRPLRVFSGRGERAAAEQLQRVVCQANQVPFGFHFGEAAEQELSEASTVLDLPPCWIWQRAGSTITLRRA